MTAWVRVWRFKAAGGLWVMETQGVWDENGLYHRWLTPQITVKCIRYWGG